MIIGSCSGILMVQGDLSVCPPAFALWGVASESLGLSISLLDICPEINWANPLLGRMS